MSPTKKVMVIHRHAPQGTSQAQDALDILLAASAFITELTVVFLDDGVFQVVSSHSNTTMFAILKEYDIQQIYVEQESLSLRGLTAADVSMAATLVTTAEFAHLLAQQDICLSF